MAVIVKGDQVLLTYRLNNKDCGQLWEFPGGKFEPGETARQALCRECDEEIGIAVTDATPLVSIEHTYPSFAVRLHVWRVDGYEGCPEPKEAQPMRWVARDQLSRYEFPAANQLIVDLITDSKPVHN